MEFISLLVIGIVAAFSVVWLINYVPIKTKTFKKIWSPRLLVCNKLLVPFDSFMTVLLICGGWIGLTTKITGIQMVAVNTFTGFGLSMGVLFARKFMTPKWKLEYQKLIGAKNNE